MQVGRLRRLLCTGVIGTVGLLSGCTSGDANFIMNNFVDPLGIVRNVTGELVGQNGSSANRMVSYVGNGWRDANGNGFWDYNEIVRSNTPRASEAIYVGIVNTDRNYWFQGVSLRIYDKEGRLVKQGYNQGKHNAVGWKFDPSSFTSGEQYRVDLLLGNDLIGRETFTPAD